ncbi:MAG TPA: hypothetical protein VLA31_11140, partial [Burkholderiaceae bacterium]|nr:hypothetical protein [Burkholderiaceae bacterium]
MNRQIVLALLAVCVVGLLGCRDLVEPVQGRYMRWNAEALGPGYQAEFKDAMAWWGSGLTHDPGSDQRAEWSPDLGERLRAVYWPSHPRRILFNGAKTWTLPEFCYASRHELGHFLGLKDSSDPNNVMYP